MRSKITEILEKIEDLQKDLKNRYDEMAKEYGYHFQKKKIEFSDAVRARHKAMKSSPWRAIFSKNIRHILSIPFIYGMIFPLIILDVCVTIYQACAFPLYQIPKAKRKDYIVYDRRFLAYLNWIEKIHCLYCSYANGLLAYAREIAARTERYWCPIKAAKNPHTSHDWYKDFADYGNAEEWKEKFLATHTQEKDTIQKCFKKN